MALGTGVIFGLWPALQLSRPQTSQMVLSGTRRVAGSVHGRRAHHALIAGQIALTLLMLVGAGSAMGGYQRLRDTPLGYDPHNVMSVVIPLHDNSYTTWAARAAYFEQLRAKVAETRGVTIAAISSNATPPQNGWKTRFETLGKPATEQQMGLINPVSPGYFSTLRIPLLQGRVWSETENRNGAHVAVINETMARLYFPNGDAIGHSIKVPDIENLTPDVLSAPNIANSWLEIVGIAGDARNDGLKKPVAAAVYVPYTLNMMQGTEILVRSAVSPLTLLHAIRTRLSSVNPDQQIYGESEDLENRIADEMEWQQDHLVSWLFSIFAVLALALAAVGLYSVVSYTVAQRTNEFGIRMALGAQRGHVLRIVLASMLMSVGGGIMSGLALTFVLNKAVAQWTDGNAHAPVNLLAGTLVLGLVAGIACAIPARRASRVDPMVALRCE